MLPIVRGSSSSNQRHRGAATSVAARSTRGRRAIATTPVRGQARNQLGQDPGVHRRHPLGQRAGQVGGQIGREKIELPRLRGDRLVQLGTKAQRVLEGVEALEHRQATIAAGGTVALHEGVAHRPIMT